MKPKQALEHLKKMSLDSAFMNSVSSRHHQSNIIFVNECVECIKTELEKKVTTK